VLTYSAVKRKTARKRTSPLGGRPKLTTGGSAQEKPENKVFVEYQGQPGQVCTWWSGSVTLRPSSWCRFVVSAVWVA